MLKWDALGLDFSWGPHEPKVRCDIQTADISKQDASLAKFPGKHRFVNIDPTPTSRV